MADLNGDLVRAAYHNRPDDVRRLLAEGADATAFAANLWPMCAAYQGGSIEIFEMLVAAGADLTKQAGGKRGPQLAAQQGKLELLRHLLAQGHDLLVVGETRTRAAVYANHHRQVNDFFVGLELLVKVRDRGFGLDLRQKHEAESEAGAAERARAWAAQEASAKEPEALPRGGVGSPGRSGYLFRAMARAHGPYPADKLATVLADHRKWLASGGAAGTCTWRPASSTIVFGMYGGPRGTEGAQADLLYANIRGAGLAGADLRRGNLCGLYAPGADLRAANFTSAMATDCDFRGADLRGAKFVRADLSRSDLRDARLDGADFSFCDLEACDLSGANLTGARFRGALLPKTRFDGPAGLATLTLRDPRDPESWAALEAHSAPAVERIDAACELLARLDEAPEGPPADLAVAQAAMERLIQADPATCLPFAAGMLVSRSPAAEVIANAFDGLVRPEHAPLVAGELKKLFQESFQAARLQAGALGRVLRRVESGPQLEALFLTHFEQAWEKGEHPVFGYDAFTPAPENVEVLLKAMNEALRLLGREKLRRSPALADEPLVRFADRTARAAFQADLQGTIDRILKFNWPEDRLWCFLVSVDWDEVPPSVLETILPRLARPDADDAASRVLRRVSATRGIDLGTREHVFIPTGLPSQATAASATRADEIPPPPLWKDHLQAYVENTLGLRPEDGLDYWKDGAWIDPKVLPDVPGRIGNPTKAGRPLLLEAAAAPPVGDARRLVDAGLFPVALASDDADVLVLAGDEHGRSFVQLPSARTTEGTIPIFLHDPRDPGVLKPVAVSFTELIGRVTLEVWGDINGCRRAARAIANTRTMRLDANWLHKTGGARVTDPAWRRALGLPDIQR